MAASLLETLRRELQAHDFKDEGSVPDVVLVRALATAKRNAPHDGPDAWIVTARSQIMFGKHDPVVVSQSRLLTLFPDADPAFVRRLLRDNNMDEDMAMHLMLSRKYDKRPGPGQGPGPVSAPKPQPAPQTCPSEGVIQWHQTYLLHRYHGLLPATQVLAVYEASGNCIEATLTALDVSVTTTTLTAPPAVDVPDYLLPSGPFAAGCRAQLSRYQQKVKQEADHAAAVAAAIAAGDVIVCPVCFDEVASPDAITCANQHAMCVRCVKAGITSRLFEDGVASGKCLEGTCEWRLPETVIQSLLKDSPRTAMVYAQVETRAALAAAGVAEALHSCPTCGDMVDVPPGNTIHACVGCGTNTCILCETAAHVPLRCDEVERAQDILARTRLENAIAAAFIRKCPACGLPFLKENGCNKITCPCGVLSCYCCQKQIENYSHFCTTANHSQEEGAPPCLACHLHDPSEKSDEARKRAAAELVMRDLDPHARPRVTVEDLL